jgi:hypothetical protein
MKFPRNESGGLSLRWEPNHLSIPALQHHEDAIAERVASRRSRALH